MNIKDSYLHGGTHVVKDITFSVPNSGTNSGKVVASITWAEEGSTVTEREIPVASSVFGSLEVHKVFAGPISGDAGNPGFRLLDVSDIPNLSASKITSDTLDGDRIPLASTTKKGGFILGAQQTSDNDAAIVDKKYWVKMNTNGKLFVDIPWDNNEWTANTKDSAGYVAVPKDISNNYLTNKVWKTDSEGNPGWRDDSDTWNEATTSLAGYIPLLAIGGDALSSSSTDYVLAYPSGTNGVTKPSWRKLPANAYLNTWTAYAAPTQLAEGTAGYITPPTLANVNRFLRGDGTWQELYFAMKKLTDWASITTVTIEGTQYEVMWLTSPTSGNQVYGLSLHNGTLYRIYNDRGTYSVDNYASNTNDWRPIRVNDTLEASESTSTKDINFVNGNNTTVSYIPAGTDQGLSGSSSYFNIKVDAVDTTYVLKIGTASNAQDVVTLLNGTSSISNTIITNTAYSLSSNKIATMADIENAVGSVFIFKGNTSGTPSGTLKIGYAYRASSTFTLLAANSATGSDESIEVGDLLVCTDAINSKFLVVNTNWSVVLPGSNVLGTSATTIATVGGVTIQATLPVASRDNSNNVTPGVISLNPGIGTSYYLREDGTWHDPNVTSAFYIGALNGVVTTDTALTNGNVYLIFKEGSVYSRFGISGSGSTSVTTDNAGNININSTIYSTFIKSGNNHAGGLVPDPGSIEGTTKFLCEDGTWKLPSYTTDTNRAVLVEGTSKIDSSIKTALNFVGSGATSIIYTAPANELTYGTITISSNNDLVKFSNASYNNSYYLPLKSGTSTDAQLLYTSAITVTGNTITASLSGNANTASDLSKGNSRGFLYQDGQSSTSLTGYGTRNTTNIGIPYIYHTDTNDDTYALGESFFYRVSGDIYLGDSIKSTKFIYVDGVTDDWNTSPTE